MGIADLLRLCRYARKKEKYAFLKGKRVAVDGYVWLHEFVAEYAEQVVLHKRYSCVVEAFVLRCQRLMDMGAIVCVVLDGCKPLHKLVTEGRTKRILAGLAAVEEIAGKREDGEDITFDASVMCYFICEEKGCEYKAKVPYSIKQHKAMVHDIDVTFFICEEKGCEYKAKVAREKDASIRQRMLVMSRNTKLMFII